MTGGGRIYGLHLPIATEDVMGIVTTTYPPNSIGITIDGDGSYLSAFVVDDNGEFRPYPSRTGVAIDTGDITADDTNGYQVMSGTLTATLNAGGSGYTASDVLTVSGGTIDLLTGITTGTAMTVVVDTVDGGGAVTAFTPSAGKAGTGDYIYVPSTLTGAATTGGTGTGCTLDLTHVTTGFSTNGSGQFVLNPENAAGACSCVVVRLGVLNGSGGWWFPRLVGAHVTFDALTQTTIQGNVELSTHMGIRIQRLGSLDGTAVAQAVMHNSASTSWRAAAIRQDLGQGNATNTWIPSATDNVALEATWDPRDANAQPNTYCYVQDLDSTSKMTQHSGLNAGLSTTGMGWTLTSNTSEADDKAFVELIAYAGPTAADEQTYTVTSVYGLDQGWSLR